mmetsp:Transcript_10070/g.11766  ORF Transcript_10070/g.11766 Transcript_10070/m.11766 type:complete len:207 (+) Transcript_10070:207-827(+)|eukprot:CAMPEP_0197862796 /NCGR_PEP_ID=MMETSP1438-20131217/39797_1 /TAXON_ID=1461541 /ORGANISM="Pterosperma sp., Strain CCMP1384" /LENGTH=206 /DNA_ID=CAMNT_0043480463 /DNA_START=199 /DNA_END=819 /DNA_ORIENTATION=-
MAAVRLTPVEEEALIKKRLLTGTKASVVSPLTKLTRKYMAFMQAAETGSVEETEKLYQDLLKELAFYELQMSRVAAIKGVTEREQAGYYKLKDNLNSSITQAQGDLETLRGDLEVAQVERKQREEYELLRRLCTEHPVRRTSHAAISNIEKEIKTLESENAIASNKLELRRKQFALLLHAADDLEQELEEEDELGEIENGATPMEE